MIFSLTNINTTTKETVLSANYCDAKLGCFSLQFVTETIISPNTKRVSISFHSWGKNVINRVLK